LQYSQWRDTRKERFEDRRVMVDLDYMALSHQLSSRVETLRTGPLIPHSDVFMVKRWMPSIAWRTVSVTLAISVTRRRSVRKRFDSPLKGNCQPSFSDLNDLRRHRYNYLPGFSLPPKLSPFGAAAFPSLRASHSYLSSGCVKMPPPMDWGTLFRMARMKRSGTPRGRVR